MPILLKIQVERTAKTRLPRRRARIGGLCGFRSSAERVPTGSTKTGRCADVRQKIRPKPSAAGPVERGDAAEWARPAACGGARDMEIASTKRQSRRKGLALFCASPSTFARSAGSFGG